MGNWPFDLRPAIAAEFEIVIGLIDDASAWLGSIGSDQWAKPWPNRLSRDERVRRHLQAGRTWIVWDDGAAAATITADPVPESHWPTSVAREPAVYLHRLVVGRNYRSMRLGAELINWAGWRARRAHEAQWIRVNAWSTNDRLHDYYLKEGFEKFEKPVEEGYPAGALFQKSTDELAPDPPSLFVVRPEY